MLFSAPCLHWQIALSALMLLFKSWVAPARGGGDAPPAQGVGKKTIFGWGMMSEEGDNLAPIIWCWGVLSTPA